MSAMYGFSSGKPSCATTSKWYPCRCIGWSMAPSFAIWIKTQSPVLATMGCVAGKPLPFNTYPSGPSPRNSVNSSSIPT